MQVDLHYNNNNNSNPPEGRLVRSKTVELYLAYDPAWKSAEHPKVQGGH